MSAGTMFIDLKTPYASKSVYLNNLPSIPFFPSPPPPPPSRPRPLRVAFQGPRGSYTHEAAAIAFPRLHHKDDGGSPPVPVHVHLLPCPSSLDSAFSAVDADREADVALVPFDNSLDGPIPRNLDLLLRHPDLRILAEFILPVNHCLLSASPSTPPRRVLAHPQAVSHCLRHLSAMDLRIDEVADPAAAARHLAETRDPSTAVIGSRMAAAEFGLAVVRRNLQDDGRNYNRFLQLGLPGEAQAVGGRGKTAVALALRRGPSDMFRAMWAFETRGVRVNRVEHRPNRGRPVRVADGTRVGHMNYVFVLEVEGMESDPRVASAIRQLDEFSELVRVLGSYDTCEPGSLSS